MGSISSICVRQKEAEFNDCLERMLELQRELTIKEMVLEETQEKLSRANRLIEEQKIQIWQNPNQSHSRRTRR